MVKAYHIAQLRHLYRQMLQPGWTDAKVSEAARGLLGPVIKEIETVFRDGDEEPHVTAADFATLEDQKTRMQAIIERHDARMQALGFARKEKREREIDKEAGTITLSVERDGHPSHKWAMAEDDSHTDCENGNCMACAPSCPVCSSDGLGAIEAEWLQLGMQPCRWGTP